MCTQRQNYKSHSLFIIFSLFFVFFLRREKKNKANITKQILEKYLIHHIPRYQSIINIEKNLYSNIIQRFNDKSHCDLSRTTIVVPRARLRFGERAFSVAAPRLWNSLPVDIRNAATLYTFKKKLKTFVFYKHLLE